MSTSPKSLERLFQSNIRMSPSRSRKWTPILSSRRAALNRAAHALAEVKKARLRYNQVVHEMYHLIKILPKLEKEYYKLARRAAFIRNANMKSGPLTAYELKELRTSAAMIKNMSTAIRTTKHWGMPVNVLPANLQFKITKFMLPPQSQVHT